MRQRFHDVGEQREAKLQPTEAAWLDDAQDAEAVEVGDRFGQDIARGVGRCGALRQDRDQCPRGIKQFLFLFGHESLADAA